MRQKRKSRSEDYKRTSQERVGIYNLSLPVGISKEEKNFVPSLTLGAERSGAVGSVLLRFFLSGHGAVLLAAILTALSGLHWLLSGLPRLRCFLLLLLLLLLRVGRHGAALLDYCDYG